MTNSNKPLKAVIVAAGSGSRIKGKTNDTPKTLLPYKGGTILSAILENISYSGIKSFVIVVGFKSKLIKEYLDKNNNFGYEISFVQNDEWKRGNGISVLVSEKEVGNNPFILSMSDHIVSRTAIKRVADSDKTANLLLVDPRVDEIFDIDDATKVELVDDRIINIGKEIAVYNGIDCGIFRLNQHFFDAMRQQLKNGKESISAAVTMLIKNKDMYAVFTQKEDHWLDIDTPEAYNHALDKFKS